MRTTHVRSLFGSHPGTLRERQRYSELAEPVITPATAYEHIVADTIEMVGVTERFPGADSSLLRYLQSSQDRAARFPTSRPRPTECRYRLTAPTWSSACQQSQPRSMGKHR
jgi:hypothetical protein